jgi:hypothetical protein
MSWRDALYHAMRVWRAGRIDLPEADRLAAGGAPGPGHPGLGALLAAVTAAPSARELAGERTAVAAFIGAPRTGVPIGTAKGTRRVRVPLPTWAAAVKVAVAVAILTIGGTAAAAETGNLPDSLQRHAHDVFSPLGVPPPSRSAPASGTDGGGVGGAGRVTTPSARPTPSPVGPSGPAMLGLCQAWDAARADPHGKAMTAEALHALVVAAGSDAAIPDFCAGVLEDNGKPSPQATRGRATDRPVPTPSHPGGPGNAPAHPTPGPHHDTGASS